MMDPLMWGVTPSDKASSNQNGWNSAALPNYSTNTNLNFPYSDLPWIGNRLITRITCDIDHVDYWGEGRIYDGIVTGFRNAYNVNHQFQLVSNGPDKGRKIPNRVPTQDYTNVSTEPYLGDRTTRCVTVMGAPITELCAKDIARLVHPQGKVIAFGFERRSVDIKNLEQALKEKHFCYFSAPLDPPLNEIALLQTKTMNPWYLIYISTSALVDIASFAIQRDDYSKASRILIELQANQELTAIQKVISAATENRAFQLGYELQGQPLISYFPDAVQLILRGSHIRLQQCRFSAPLKLEWHTDRDGDRAAYAARYEESNHDRFEWMPRPVENGKYFTLENRRFGMPLKLEWHTDCDGDRGAFGGSTDRGIEPGNATRFHWLFRLNSNGSVTIQNRMFNMYLKVGWNPDRDGDRQAYGGSTTRGIEADNADRFQWRIQAL
ncbi:30K protein 18 [Pelomyxa schiedti]|nr:30K protein 18 [Pelomyxa schiedti]